MKKIFFSVIILFTSIFSFGQISKGQKMLGGSLQFKSEKDKNTFNDDKTTDNYIIFSPQFAIGLNNNWIIGIAPSLTSQVIKSESFQPGNVYNHTTKAKFYTGSIFLRKYYSFNDKAGVYMQIHAGAGAGDSRSKTTLNGTVQPGSINNAKATEFSSELKPGLYFKLTNKILIESSFGGIAYSHLSRKFNSSSTKQITNTVDFTMGKTLTLGVNYIF